MKALLVVFAACATTTPPPAVERVVPPVPSETFVLDAPLYKRPDASSVVWTLERDGHTAHLELGSRDHDGTVRESGGVLHIDLGDVTMICKRTRVQVHVAGAKPEPRGDHPPCSAPTAWRPAELVTTDALACSVHLEGITTEVTLAPPPGLQSVVTVCCNDADRCGRRWELQRRS